MRIPRWFQLPTTACTGGVALQGVESPAAERAGNLLESNGQYIANLQRMAPSFCGGRRTGRPGSPSRRTNEESAACSRSPKVPRPGAASCASTRRPRQRHSSSSCPPCRTSAAAAGPIASRRTSCSRPPAREAEVRAAIDAELARRAHAAWLLTLERRAATEAENARLAAERAAGRKADAAEKRAAAKARKSAREAAAAARAEELKTMPRVALSGHTYPHRAAIRAAGGEWDAAAKTWRVPADVSAALQSAVDAGPPKSTYALAAEKKRAREQAAREARMAGAGRGCWPWQRRAAEAAGP